MLKAAITILLAITSTVGVVRAQSRERPEIVEARVYVVGEFLVGDLRSRGLFSEQVAGTVQSGLPAVVELLFSIVAGRDNTVNRGILAYELQYDVWEDHYMITDVDSTRYYPSFGQMSAAMQNLKKVRVIPLTAIDEGADYTLRLSVAVHPLRSREQNRIVGWIGENVSGDTEAATHKQMIDLNGLIRHFFAREKDVSNRSEWYQTDTFKPGLLGSVKEE
jgi:hypothetical protein